MTKRLEEVLKEFPGIYVVSNDINETAALPEGWDYAVTCRKPVLNEDIFLTDSGDVPMFGLKKKFLINLAADAGVKFDINGVKVEKQVAENGDVSYVATASAIIMTPQGEKSGIATHTADLSAMTEKYRESLINKVRNGLPDNRRTREIEKAYLGQWKQLTEKQRVFHLDKTALPAYIEKCTRQYMMEQRINAPQSSETRARMRLIKTLLNLDSVYPYERINEPFVVIRPYQKVAGIQGQKSAMEEINRLKEELAKKDRQVLVLSRQLQEKQANGETGKINQAMFQ